MAAKGSVKTTPAAPVIERINRIGQSIQILVQIPDTPDQTEWKTGVVTAQTVDDRGIDVYDVTIGTDIYTVTPEYDIKFIDAAAEAPATDDPDLPPETAAGEVAGSASDPEMTAADIGRMSFADLKELAKTTGVEINTSNIFMARKALKDALFPGSTPPATTPASQTPTPTKVKNPPVETGGNRVPLKSQQTPAAPKVKRNNKREVLQELLNNGGGTPEFLAAQLDERCGGSSKENHTLVAMFGGFVLGMNVLVDFKEGSYVIRK